jgi:asparagine synthase (glutamine-hydrolysing)
MPMKASFIPSGFELRIVSGKNDVAHENEPFADGIPSAHLIKQRFNDKFSEDKLCQWVGDYFIVLDGVITNRDELAKGKSWAEVVHTLIENFNVAFPSKLRGSFSGAYLDKKSKKWVVFCDHISSKSIFYSQNKHNTIISSHAAHLYEGQKCLERTNTLSEQACYMLLTYGFMLDGYTLDENVKKLAPGNVLVIDENNQLDEKQYFSLPKQYNNKIRFDDALHEVDNLFSNAVKLQFEADKKYGYKHLTALSGGLDSRMTTWVAHNLGYVDQVNFTYSQNGYLDETIAREIAFDLGHEWIFKALNNGPFLKDLDSCNDVSSGLGLSYGIGQGLSIHRYINFDEFGIVHSGSMGDLIIGSYHKDNYLKPLAFAGLKADSKKLLDKVIPYNQVTGNMKETENFIFNQRGWNGINVGTLTSGYRTETISPFCDPDLLSYTLSIKLEFRIEHKLYKEWILKYHRGASEYIWETNKRKITDKPIMISFRGKLIPMTSIIPMTLSKLGFSKNGQESGNHMNPVSLWYNSDVTLQNYSKSIFDIFEDKKISIELLNDCKYLLANGNGVEKNAVYTLASAVNKWF